MARDHMRFGEKWDHARCTLLMKAIAFLSLVFSLACPVRAMSVDATKLPSWRINDLTKESPTIRMFLRGAEATIVPKKGQTVPTVLVFEVDYDGNVDLGADVFAWENYVRSIELNPKITFRNAKAYLMDGQPRFYAELLEDRKIVEGTQTFYTAILVVLNGRHLMAFEYGDTKEGFLENVDKVRRLYRQIKIEK